MGTNEVILLRAQAGIESTRGTNVAATRKVYAQISPSYTRALLDFMDTSGTYQGRRRAAYGRAKVGFTALDLATFEDLPWWMQLGLKGGVAGVGDSGSPEAFVYTFNPTISSDDLSSITLEHGETNNDYETAQVMMNSFTLRMDSDNDSEPTWMLDAELIGRDWATTSFTAALSDRSTETIDARGTKIYIDAAGGTMGTTQLSGALISASITVNNNIHFKAFAEDVEYVAANKVGRQQQTLDAQFTFEFENDTEFANYRATAGPVQRLIRLEKEGSTIHTTVKKRFRFDMYGYWNSWSRGDREGNLTATFGFAGFYDATASKTFQMEIVNALETLP